VGPFKGHTNWVYSVAFSQNSKCIVSGSGDHTTRVWDAETGEVVVEPLKGHTNWVNSVEFLQDGRHVIPGSSDHTIRIFSVLDKDLVSGFTDASTLVRGWIHNSSSKVLFWVPYWNRPGLCWPKNSFVIALCSPSTHLDLVNFVHGDSWQQCKA
jgi:WD40 repeat protein